MAYKLAVLVALVAATAAASIATNEESSLAPTWPRMIQIYKFKHGTSPNPSKEFTDFVPALSKFGWNDKLVSACVTGIWVFYNNENYNAGQDDAVFWAHGLKFCFDVPSYMNGITSSFRYGGSGTQLDESSFTLFEEYAFQGAELFNTDSMTDLGTMSANAESIIISGTSQWTFYKEKNYGGTAICFKSNQVDLYLHVGMIDTLELNWKNSIKSVQKGCHTTTMMEYGPLKASHQAANGAMGSFVVKRQ